MLRPWVFFSFFASAAAVFAQASAPVAPPAQVVQKAVNRYCYSCHNEQVKSGGLSLHGAKADAIPSSAATWEKILRKVRSSEMPPPDAPKPDAALTQQLLQHVSAELDRGAKRNPDPGAPVVHRLNRAEYSNAIRDLLALDLDHSASLPADDSGYGFDNIGEVLTVSPLLLEKYMTTARRVARLALGTVRAASAIEKYTPGRGRESLPIDALPLSERGGMALRRYFPLNAEYSILVRVRGTPDASLPQAKLDIRVDGVRRKLVDLAVDNAEENQHTRNYEIRLPLAAGMHDVAAAFLSESMKAEPGVIVARRFGPPPTASDVSVDYITIGGPFEVRGPGATASRKRILVCHPAARQPEEVCAKRILSTLARRAYRRPVTPSDLAPLMKLFAQGRTDGKSFEAGIETALRAVLVSPNFLFRVERNPKGALPGTIHRVSQLELASRLSFFLWSSIPDDELLRLASLGQLRAALPAQVKRMLADSKVKALVENFGGQWLHLRNVASWRPDPEKYKDFDDQLRGALETETRLFFEYIVHQDRSVMDFIDADYTFLNARLARHYGLKDVRGNYFRRVSVDPKERGGILSQGSVLMVTSYPTRTSPVLRGKWILENVLGSPPPPPPPDVPDLEDKAGGSAKDLRAALEKHRANAACASCHARLDPMGFALENYDGTGKFRKSEGGADIDSSGALPNGMTVHGPGELKKILMTRKEEFLDCLAEKFLTYALGRGLEHTDLPAVRDIRRQTAAGDYRFSSLALAVVNSTAFQMRRTPQL